MAVGLRQDTGVSGTIATFAPNNLTALGAIRAR